MTVTRPIHAPRGTTLTCKGWLQEAALRMLMNNLDPEVAERPDDLVVYGGRGQAAQGLAAVEDAVVEDAEEMERGEEVPEETESDMMEPEE